VRKQRKFSAATIVREIARDRIGSPKPTSILVDKRRVKRDREITRELRARKGSDL
jgi:hypothetical protein